MGDRMPPGAAHFEVLGPLQVWRDGEEVNLGQTQQRVMLAVLLLHANRPVSRQRLMDAVWGPAAPGRAMNLLQRHAAGLRRALEPHRPARTPSRLLTWTDAGYVLTVPAGRLDLDAFTERVKQARAARTAGDLSAAAETFHSALRLWRGRLCEGLSSPLLDAERERLAEHRLSVLEDRIEVDLELGRQAEVVAELAGLVREHPLRERLHAHLMLALYRSGRQAEALETYRKARQALIDELGIEPSPVLRNLERAVLTGDRELQLPAVARPRPTRTPSTLPGDVADFTGREDQLKELDALVPGGPPSNASTAAPLCVIAGTPGVGKTALAVHWAHRVREAFPDGQLYVNLRGYDPEQPVSAHDASARLLTALGLAEQAIPPELEDRTALYRSELADRRLLVLLDNAAATEQVIPLLPGSPSCSVVITSRSSLPGLVALHGAQRLHLDLLPADDAHALLHRLIGARVTAAPQAATDLANLCVRLPLALRIAAELASSRPHSSLSELATDLAHQQRRLDLLDADEESSAAVRAVFSWSYEKLCADAARTFRLLALHPGPDLDTYAAAALTHVGPEQTRRWLRLLTRAHLIQHTGPDRYSMHDLLRVYGAELAGATDPESERQAALTRLIDHYLAIATTASNTLDYGMADQFRRYLLPPSVASVPPAGTPQEARTLLNAERANLVAMCAHCAHHESGRALDLAATLFRYLDIEGHHSDALTIHTHARHAACHIGDRDGEAYALTGLGLVCWRQGRYQLAVTHYRRALCLFRQVGNRDGEAYALTGLGWVAWRQGRYRAAVTYFRQALTLFRRTGNPGGQGYALIGLGLAHWRQGRYDLADAEQREALELFQQTSNRNGKAWALSGLGAVLWRTGHDQEAVEHQGWALELFQQVGNRDGEAFASLGLGWVRRQLGHGRQAADDHRQALEIFQQVGNKGGEAHALTGLGSVLRHQGHHQQAAEHHRQALALFQQTGDRAGEAMALNGLGEALQVGGHMAQARARHGEALAVAAEIDDRHEQARARNGLTATHRASGDLRCGEL